MNGVVVGIGTSLCISCMSKNAALKSLARKLFPRK